MTSESLASKPPVHTLRAWRMGACMHPCMHPELTQWSTQCQKSKYCPEQCAWPVVSFLMRSAQACSHAHERLVRTTQRLLLAPAPLHRIAPCTPAIPSRNATCTPPQSVSAQVESQTGSVELIAIGTQQHMQPFEPHGAPWAWGPPPCTRPCMRASMRRKQR